MAYEQKPGQTGSISAGGEYDNLDTVDSLSYENLSAENAAAAAVSAAAAATSATSAANSATNAAASATTASNAAATVNAGVAAAAASATAAANSATSASTSATNAANSATSASTSAATATTQATNAATSATSASTSATNAASSASSAASSASNASTSASTATTQADIATTQASIATTQASNASTSASQAATSATNSANSASAASTSATNAANSATTATTQAGIATTQATNSAASATSSANSATASASAQLAAEAARDQALAAFDSFDDKYLGEKASDPTVDNDGNPLVAGALYFNSTINAMKVYTGSAWVLAYVSGGTYLAVANNLSDLQSVPTARTNLGLGTAATTDSTAYATAAQGISADTAFADRFKWDGGATGLVAATGRTSLGLGTAATTDSTAYATAAQGALADTAIQTLTSTDGSLSFTSTGTTRDISVVSTNKVIVQVRNSTGATLTKGTAVYISGATGQISTVSKALASGDSTSAQTLGLVNSDIPNNTNGNITIIGLITNIDTSSYADGQQLYLSPTVAGTLTSTKPYAPSHIVYMAVVEYAHPTQGKLFVKVQNGYELDELHDVAAQSPTNGQTIVYNSTTGLWEKSFAPVITGTTIDNTSIGATTASSGSFTTLTASADPTFTSTGAVQLPSGTTAQQPAGVAGKLRFNTTTGQFEGYNGIAWASVGGSAITVNNDVSTATDLYPLFSSNTSGTVTAINTSNANLLYTPSTGELKANQMNAMNGIFVNSQTISVNYTVPTGSNALSSGPVTVNTGVIVTVSSDSTWTVV